VKQNLHFPAAEMDDEQFRLWQSMLEKRIGMHLPMQRKQFLQTSVAMRMRQINCSAYDEYYTQLFNERSSAREWRFLLDCITVKETSFFRHPPSFQLVSTVFHQRVVEQQQKDFNVWSVGCATGEEAYSLGIMLEYAQQSLGTQVFAGVTGTDISQQALTTAREGVYSSRSLRELGDYFRTNFFREIGPDAYRVSESVRERVCFSNVNVQDLADARLDNMDVIFCQNMLIYFRRWRQRQIIGSLAERLSPNGVLVLGSCETIDRIPAGLERVAASGVFALRRIG